MNRTILTALVLSGLVVLLVAVAELLGIRVFERIATNLCISLILVIGLQIFMGNSGILSFAHIGFMGVGAYATAVLTIPVQMKGMALPDLYGVLAGIQLHPIVATVVAGLFAGFVAALFSWPLMRLSDAAAVITSFALLVVLHTIMTNWSNVTNGPRTLFGVPKATDIWVASAVAVLAILGALAFKESRSGRLLRASRDDERAAAALGVRIPYLRWQAFVIAAFYAGVGGALWGHFITSFSPNAFWLRETFVILGMLVIGGANTVTGAVIGTFIVTGAYESLRAVEGALNETKWFAEQVIGVTEIVLALAMIAVLILRPGGLFPTREIGAVIGRALSRKGSET